MRLASRMSLKHEIVLLTVTVSNPNQSPTATAQSVTGSEDTTQIIPLSGSDPDGDSLTYALASNPSNGSATLSGNVVTYTPMANWSGSDSFTVTVSDGTATSSAVTVSITVSAINDPPTATAQSVSGSEDVTQTITLAGTDADGDSLTYVASNPSNGSVTLSGNVRVPIPTNTTSASSVIYSSRNGSPPRPNILLKSS